MKNNNYIVGNGKFSLFHSGKLQRETGGVKRQKLVRCTPRVRSPFVNEDHSAAVRGATSSWWELSPPPLPPNDIISEEMGKLL